MNAQAVEARALERFSDRWWRLNTLYQIRTKQGEAVRFEVNEAQERLFRDLHYLNVVLKARQLGMTTFIQIYMLDECLFRKNTNAGTIAHTLDDAVEIFDNKVKFAYEHLDDALRAAVPAKQDSARKLSFANGSSIRVGTSLRSGTYQLLHVSEYGKICAKYPEKAKEIRTGALNTVEAGNVIFVESTAEGTAGDFADMVKRAQRQEELGAELTPLDFKLHFFPWFDDPGYRLEPEEALKIKISADQQDYFDKLETDLGVKLSPGQRAWYVAKLHTQHEDMLQEYPSTPEEAFKSSIQGAYYAPQMRKAREERRICRVPYEALPVNTFWDLGIDDETSIWLHQRLGLENRFIRFFKGSGEGAAYYAKWLLEWQEEHDAVFGKHYLPHDGQTRSMVSKKTYKDTLSENGLKNIVIVPRTVDVIDDIQKVRNVFPSCWFDEEGCAEGLEGLDNYCKEWDPNRSTFKPTPRHDWASHPADAFRTFAKGFKAVIGSADPTKPIGRKRKRV